MSELAPEVDVRTTYNRRTRRFTIKAATKADNPERLGVLLGDWAHNLRSALDHLMWQLVILYGGTPNRRTQFPIFQRKRDYDKRAPAMIGGTIIPTYLRPS